MPTNEARTSLSCEYFSRGAMTSSEQAAWFQAIASLVAIAIAIAVPAAQHWLDRRSTRLDKQDRARSMALSLMGDFQVVGDKLNRVWSHEHPDELDERTSLGSETLAALEIPPKLDNLADRLYELGDAAKSAQHCVYHIRAAREYLTTVEGGQKIAFDKKRFYDHLWEATRGVGSLQNRIDAMFPSEPERPETGEH